LEFKPHIPGAQKIPEAATMIETPVIDTKTIQKRYKQEQNRYKQQVEKSKGVPAKKAA
jgi:hypothetical protein